MVTANVTATTLEQLYAQLVAAQKKAHGEDYVLHHDVIRECLKECSSYAELGVRQGTTLACATLAMPGFIVGVDRDLSPVLPFWPLFEKYCEHRMLTEVHLVRQDSRIPFERPFQFLFIDSYHTTAHLREELAAHGRNVGRYLLVHDTTAVPALFSELQRWVSMTPGWSIVQHETRSVGFTLCRRS